MYFSKEKINQIDSLLTEFSNAGIKIGETHYGLLNTGNPQKTGFWHMNSNVYVTPISFPNGKTFWFCEWSTFDSGSWFYVYDFDVILYLNKGCL